MNHRRSFLLTTRTLRAGLFGFVPLGIALSCGSGEDEAPPPPPGPIAIAIDELRPRANDTWRRGDAEPVVVGCDRQLAVKVDLYDPVASAGGGASSDRLPGDWLLRPPGACGRPQCGTVGVSVQPLAGGPAVTAEAALTSVVVDLGPLGDALEGRILIRAELRQNGTTPATKDGVPLADELEVTLTSDDCAPGGEAGAGGMPSGTGGTGGTGNAGGQAGAGAPATGGTGATGPGPGGMGGIGGEGGA